ncbi:MAG: phosphomannomutase/phosphoglucomutase [Candidatus Kerfeldbacteria bacterium]|nr:phosphomannomutase/phosphoglucomutase [Candidatus Kerfeldbacteria bacterium]
MQTIHQKVFKSYDVRGIYPTDLTVETAFLIGQAYAQLTSAKKVVIGRDMRIGSPELAAALIKGLTSQGVIVDDIGMVSIDMTYFTVGTYDYDGGMMVTASHNPREYNGIKMVVKHGDQLQYVRGKELYDFIQDKKFTDSDQPGTVQSRDVMNAYIQHVLSFVDQKALKPFTIVVDAGNGMAGKVIPELTKQLPGTIIPLNFTLDGTFPAHPSNPLMPESQVEITQAVIKHKADFGVIFDGDTDRLFFVTETGVFIRADATLLILAKYFLERYPGAGIAYNVICSKAVPERIAEWGGRPLRSKVGFVNVAQTMREGDGVMSGELSAHYAYKDNFYADSGFISFAILWMLISQHNKKLSTLVADLIPYAKSDEINIETDETLKVITEVKQKYADGTQDELDGLTVQYPTWWFNVRPSNTEPLLRITLEADTPELLEEKKTEVVSYIKSIIA